MKKFEEIIDKHYSTWQSDGFEDWKITEIMYCRLQLVLEALDGSDDLEHLADIVIEVQSFIEDLQNLEK